MDPLRDDAGLLTPPAHVWARRPKFQDRVWLHALLFVLTLASTTLVGASHWLVFRSNFAPPGEPVLSVDLLVRGLWYSGTLVAILGCHELGHYFACRYYDLDASLPFFLPIPILPSGTLGAFIRIREPIPRKQMLTLATRPTTDFVYVRWMGPDRDIVDYSRIQVDRMQELEAWAGVLWPLAELRVKVYGYVNNHFAGHSPESARALQRLLGISPVDPSTLGEQMSLF